MTFASLAPASATETHRDSSGRERQLIYRKRNSKHQVIVDVSGNVFPRVNTFRTIDEARRYWKEQREVLAGEGFRRITR